MPTVEFHRVVAAPPERVFDAVADIANFSTAVPGITKIEFLTTQKVGVGTRFNETRVMNGREGTVELEVTEYERPERFRIVSDEGGTVWDTVMTVVPQGDGAELNMTMEARPHSLMGKITTPMVMKMVAKAMEGDMDAVKAWCERDEREGEAGDAVETGSVDAGH